MESSVGGNGRPNVASCCCRFRTRSDSERPSVILTTCRDQGDMPAVRCFIAEPLTLPYPARMRCGQICLVSGLKSM